MNKKYKEKEIAKVGKELIDYHMFSKEHVDKTIQDRDKEIIKIIKALPDTKPENESDMFDYGMQEMKENILSAILIKQKYE